MRLLLTSIIALVAGFAGAALWDFSGLRADPTREYLMAHPEVLPEAMQVLQQREQQARIGPLRGELETPFPGAILGNPDGDVTLVEFSDYACTYCRQSLSDVEQLIAANPDLKVVIREYPILRPESVDAARMALAAAEQGKYAAFHDAMFRLGPPTDETIEAAAKDANLDLDRARAAIATGAFDMHLQTNAALASQLGITGTPGWVIGDRAMNGAVGRDRIGEAIAEARES
ncbi:protein-disulfide isomerase [Altererythrobacter atlanticus]|uniref:DSBA-like thioredoxin domain protein n=1 Tax=Croceibacterium atlanticum TaxID=1267766 RepID=A0A0F7KS32_9SPHN|nr:DsbA family protein [Croceibacterium atlanticum]AKH43268.1 DSBA-like thioredoxin domain protein [Croceibacterium atlanticum]MBB5732026.1 protein-disulfide isomerase [Croceibacterium atlanticum]